MSIKFDWLSILKTGGKAFIKAILPLLSGALGGILAGCTVGSGPNFTF